MSVVHLIAECLSAKICRKGNQIISIQRTALFFYGFLFRQTTTIESKGIGRVKMALLPPHFHDLEKGRGPQEEGVFLMKRGGLLSFLCGRP